MSEHEQFFRCPKGAERHLSTAASRFKPLSDAQICARAMNCVIDAGGDVTTVTEAAGTVWLHGRVERRSAITPLRRILSEIPGVTRVVLRLKYDVDDTVQPSARLTGFDGGHGDGRPSDGLAAAVLPEEGP